MISANSLCASSSSSWLLPLSSSSSSSSCTASRCGEFAQTHTHRHQETLLEDMLSQRKPREQGATFTREQDRGMGGGKGRRREKREEEMMIVTR